MKAYIHFRKTSLVTMLVFLLFITGIAQDKTHTGFYLSMQTGPVFGYVNGNTNIDYSLKVTGPAFGFDIQIGGAIRENTILHGNIGFKSIYRPEVEIQGMTGRLDKTFDETMIGIGATQYFNQNFFVTAVLGLGNFSLYDDVENSTVSTEDGFSYQLKAGKEWWISSRWALGAALEYGGTRTKDTSGSYEETWQSHRFSIRFTATLNGRKQ